MNTTVNQATGKPWIVRAASILILCLLAFAPLTPLTLLTQPPAHAQNANAGRDLSTDLIQTAEIIRTRNSRDTLIQNESVTLNFTWDVSKVTDTDRAPKAGDFIRVNAPEWLRFNGARVDMKDPSGNVVANCVETATAPSYLTCTFTDYVEQNPRDLKGEYSTLMNVTTARTITNSSFPVGPVTLEVTDIVDPGKDGRIIAPPSSISCRPLQDATIKNGNWDGPNAQSGGRAQLWWDVLVRGTGSDIQISDTLLRPQEPGRVLVYERDGSTENETRCNWNREGASGGAARPLADSERTVSWSQTAQGEEKLDLVIPNSDPNKHYRVVIYAFVPADAFKLGSRLSNEATVNSQKVTAQTTATRVTNASASGNPDLGGVWVYKTVQGNAQNLVPANSTFTVKATWDQDGTEHSEELTVTPGETPAKLENLPKNTKVTLSELRPTDTDNYTWGDPVFGDGRYGTATSDQVVVSADKQSAVVTIKGGENWPIHITNTATATPKFGKFLIQKALEGTDAAKALVPADTEFTVDYSYPAGDGFEPGAGTITFKADGTPVESPELPAGAVVTFKEQTPPAIDGIAWGTPTIAPDSVTIAEGEPATVTVTNPVSETMGSFSLVKKISGDASALVPADTEFTVDYSYPAGDGFEAGEGSITVKADGTVAQSGPIPHGAKVTLQEKTPANIEGATWEGGSFDTTEVTIDSGSVTNVVLTNTYNEVPPTPEPSESATPEPSEPATPEPSDPGTEPATPEPSESATPEPSEPATPEPSDPGTPEPSESASPEPSESATPEPSEPGTEPASPEPSDSATAEPSKPTQDDSGNLPKTGGTGLGLGLLGLVLVAVGIALVAVRRKSNKN